MPVLVPDAALQEAPQNVSFDVFTLSLQFKDPRLNKTFWRDHYHYHRQCTLYLIPIALAISVYHVVIDWVIAETSSVLLVLRLFAATATFLPLLWYIIFESRWSFRTEDPCIHPVRSNSSMRRQVLSCWASGVGFVEGRVVRAAFRPVLGMGGGVEKGAPASGP